jgi:transcriptional regulator with XRE-family HTH domain
MLSVEQIKAARAFLGWSAEDLAKVSGVGATTLRRYEMGSGVPSANVSTLSKIKLALEEAGIEFTGDPVKNPGVVLHIER